jgi:[protein-PII] uridylyltransferase
LNLRLIDRKLQNDPEANRLFIDMLTGPNPEITLTRLNEAGVFGRFVPDFGRVVAQMQYDMYHVYTVDEHTIRAIGILKGIETGRLKADHPVACAVIGEVQSLRALYVSVLLHDIAKGRGGDHSVIGAEVAQTLCPRFGLNEWETETVSWLVLKHLLMSNTAFKRDIYNPKTISDFTAIVQSPERLRLLNILTVADIRAVGPTVWNAWKAGLLRELYYRSFEELSGSAPLERRAERVVQAKTELKEKLIGWSAADIESHFARGFPDYWLTFDADTLKHHAEFVRNAEAKKLKLHVETRVDPARDVTEIVIYTPDHPGLFARIAGALALSGASVVDAKIMTLANSMALDTFWIQDANGHHYAAGDRLKRLCMRVEDALMGRLNPGREIAAVQQKALPSRTKVFKVPPRVLIDNKASDQHTVIEINGRDRLGLLHDLTAALTASGLQISSAHIATFGERIVDVFYVKDVFGLKVDREEKLRALRYTLLEAVQPGAGETERERERQVAKTAQPADETAGIPSAPAPALPAPSEAKDGKAGNPSGIEAAE